MSPSFSVLLIQVLLDRGSQFLNLVSLTFIGLLYNPPWYASLQVKLKLEVSQCFAWLGWRWHKYPPSKYALSSDGSLLFWLQLSPVRMIEDYGYPSPIFKPSDVGVKHEVSRRYNCDLFASLVSDVSVKPNHFEISRFVDIFIIVFPHVAICNASQAFSRGKGNVT